jgi:hypothetical protein
LAPASLSWWKQRLAKTAPPRFVALQVIARAASAESSPASTSARELPNAVIEVVLRDERLLRVPAGFDPEHLRQLVRALEVEPC